MIEKENNKKFICVFILLMILIGGGYLKINANMETGAGVFSWYPEDVEKADFFECIKNKGATKIYQLFSDDLSYDVIATFVGEASKKGISIYALAGECEWAIDESAKDVISEIDRVKRYNEKLNYEERIKGIVLDIEPHLLPQWEKNSNQIMEQYSSVIEKCSEQKGNLELYICIPFYYDSMGYEEYLEKWIREYLDGFLVMNYSVGREKENISNETEICRRYNKALVTIYELNKPGDAIDSSNTYYGKMTADVVDNFKMVKKELQYDKLGIAFHEYRAFKEMD